MKKLSVVVAAVAALAATTARAEEPVRRWSIAPLVGAYIATGDQRDVLDDSLLTGLTLSYEIHPNLAVVGAFSWAPTQDLRENDLDLFQYDLGLQGQYPVALTRSLTLKPFVGVGLGARTYEYRDLAVDAETDFAGYVSAGAGLEYEALELRLTARDYLSAFDGIGVEGDSSARNDLSLFASVGLRF
jgi:outer membrane protein with beta-barrel domain